MDDNNGLSAVIVNSEKGTLFLNRSEIVRRQFEIDTILKYNQSLLTSFDEGAQRAAFYAYTERCDLERAIETFFRRRCCKRQSANSGFSCAMLGIPCKEKESRFIRKFGD